MRRKKFSVSTASVGTMGDVSECNIKVICRVRPLNDAEERNGSQMVVRVVNDDSVSLAVSEAFISSVCRQ